MAKNRKKRRGTGDGGSKDQNATDATDADKVESEDASASATDATGSDNEDKDSTDAKSGSEEPDASESDNSEASSDESPSEEAEAANDDSDESSSDNAESESKTSSDASHAPEPKGAAWANPIARFEAGWTRLETRLLTWVLIAQLLSMVAWVLLSGLSSPIQSGNASGLVMRGVLGAVAFGMITYFALKKADSTRRNTAVFVAIVAGALVAKLWRSVGVDYFDNVRSWLQEGSTLTLMGGLRGVATRLTLWLALLGASLATGAGKHINIDVVFRFIPDRVRRPVALVNYTAAALICLGAVWGFFDHIAIESYGANADDTAGTKVSLAADRFGEHMFLLRKQMKLDLKTFPHIVKNDRFDRWMGPKEWNDWVKDNGFSDHYSQELVDTILVPEDSPPHTPLVLSPDGESTRGMLVHDLGLVFPFGMLMIALRFLLRVLLVLSRHIDVDPNAAHKEEIGHAKDAPMPEKGAA